MVVILKKICISVVFLIMIKCCYSQDCTPTDCRWSAWTTWSECDQYSSTIQSRHITDMPSCGGRPCEGVNVQERTCSDCLQECRTEAWTQWSVCDVFGRQHRRREISLTNVCEYVSCPDIERSQERACCEPLDCVWGPWSPWVECREGNGSSVRIRSIAQYVNCGGNNCTGSAYEMAACCPEQECNWAQWGDWSPCQDNVRVRQRVESQLEKCVKSSCQGFFNDSQPCRDEAEVLRNCNFDDKSFYSPLCNLQFDYSTSKIYWTLHTGQTPGENTGVKSAAQGNNFVYMEASYKNPGDIARFSLLPNYRGLVCVSFFYSMYGEGIGALTVSLGELGRRIVWAQSGNKGPGWLNTSLTLSVTEADKVSWTGIRGSSYLSDMALDDIVITNRSCSGTDECTPMNCTWEPWSNWSACYIDSQSRHRGIQTSSECGGNECDGNIFETRRCCQPIQCLLTQWAPWSVCKNNVRTRQRDVLQQPECGGNPCGGQGDTGTCTALFVCDFEENMCGMERDDFWYIGAGRLFMDTGPSIGYNSSGHYAYAKDNYAGSIHNISTPVLGYTGSVVLTFAYYMFGRELGSLSLYKVGFNRNSLVIWAVSGDKGMEWYRVSINLTLHENDKIVWTAISGGDASVPAIDSINIAPLELEVEVTKNPPVGRDNKSVLLSCTFEQDQCGLFIYFWSTGFMRTDSRGTGPTRGHNNSMQYLYRTSQYFETYPVADVRTDVIGFSGNVCVEFFYHMYGKEMGSLNLIVMSNDMTYRTVWSRSGDQSRYWWKAKETVYVNPLDRIVWRGTLGGRSTSDMAIDSILITKDVCINQVQDAVELKNVTCGTPLLDALNPSESQTNIFMGTKVDQGARWPWMVSITSDGLHYCGGVILNSSWILTAGHCINGEESDRIQVIAGDYNRTQDEGTEQMRYLKRWIKHEQFEHTEYPFKVTNDIGLMEVDFPFTFTRRVMPVCAPQENTTYSNCYMTGWGRTHSTGSTSPILLQAKVNITDQQTCLDRYPFYTWLPNSGAICLNSDESAKSCMGDSGGPLLCQVTLNGPWVVTGVSSWGPTGCDAQLGPSSVFTDVTKYLDWLSTNCNGCI